MQWIILLLKIFLISGFVSIATWIAVYSRLARWWTNPVGRALVAKSILVGALLVPSTLSLFFNLNRLDSVIVGWVDVALIGLITPAMAYRVVVWLRLHKAGGLPPDN